MANDIDMWNDIKMLEKKNPKQAKDLLEIYRAYYIDNKQRLADTLKLNFRKKWGYIQNYK